MSIVAAVHHQVGTANAAAGIGVCYGMLGNNLPAATDVVGLYKKYNIGKMRLFDPNPQALDALRGSNILVTLGMRNEDLPNLASSQEAVDSWFATNVQPYLNDVVFSYISVGNEVVGGVYGQHVAAVMQFLQNTLNANKLSATKVTTVLSADTLGSSYPPSSGAFKPELSNIMGGILGFLSKNGSPLLVNVYPYFAYAGDPVNVRLDYAQFTATGPVVHDGELSYWNLFDAMVDSFIWAVEKMGVTNVNVVVSESGWPSAGNGNLTTPELASTYNRNLMQHVMNNGTPKRPGALIEGFVFALFNENQKAPGVEQNFGLFYPNMTPVYPMFPNSVEDKHTKLPRRLVQDEKLVF